MYDEKGVVKEMDAMDETMDEQTVQTQYSSENYSVSLSEEEILEVTAEIRF